LLLLLPVIVHTFRKGDVWSCCCNESVDAIKNAYLILLLSLLLLFLLLLLLAAATAATAAAAVVHALNCCSPSPLIEMP